MFFEPTPGLVFIAPGVAAIFAVIGAFFGFLASLFGYFVYTVTGGKMGSKNVNFGGSAFKTMLSPKMLAVSCTLSVIGTYIGMGWYYETWNVHAQFVKMSGEMFNVQDAGPMLAMVAAMVGLTAGMLVGKRLFPKAAGLPHAPSAPRRRLAGTAAACPVHAKGYFVARIVVTTLGLVLTTYAGVAAYYGNWSPAGVAGEVAAWWTPLQSAQIVVAAEDPKATNPCADGVADLPRRRRRTGCLDGKDGPAAGQILWTYGNGGSEKFLAAPAVVGDYVFAGGTNAGVGGMFYTFHAADKGGGRKQLVGEPDRAAFPVFSPPAMVGGKLVVGEGLHEDEKTALRRLNLAAKSAADRIVWELPVPSHLESGPAVVGDRVFTGAGDEGILCVSLKDIAKPASYDKELELHTPAEPKVLWRQAYGDNDKKIKLHADTSPAVVGDSVVIGSGRFTDMHKGEKVVVGDCSVVCLNAADGAVRCATRSPRPTRRPR